MGYFGAMDAIIPTLGALLAAALQPTAGHGTPAAPGPASAVRFGGASASATILARIIRSSARIGVGLGPPAKGMVARAMTVSAADGRAVPALVYDFE